MAAVVGATAVAVAAAARTRSRGWRGVSRLRLGRCHRRLAVGLEGGAVRPACAWGGAIGVSPLAWKVARCDPPAPKHIKQSIQSIGGVVFSLLH